MYNCCARSIFWSLHRSFNIAIFPEDAFQMDSLDSQSLTSSSPQACFFETISASETSELWRWTRKANRIFWLNHQNHDFAKFPRCVSKLFQIDIWIKFFISTGALLIISEKICYGRLLFCRVGEVWKMKLSEPCLEISTERNIQPLHFWLTYFRSRSQNSPWPNVRFFPQSLLRNDQSCIAKQQRRNNNFL